MALWEYNELATLAEVIVAVLALLVGHWMSQWLLYPGARPVRWLWTRLRSIGPPLEEPIVRFNLNLYSELTDDEALILQGRNQEGKTTLLRTAIPWWRCLPILAHEGVYLNGGKDKQTGSLKGWLTAQLFGHSFAVGSELQQTLEHYRDAQWFRRFLELIDIFGTGIRPKPMFVLVDQFEELLIQYGAEAWYWANEVTNQHTRDKLARVVFVVNSDAGAQTLLNLNQGVRFKKVVLEPVSGEEVHGLSRRTFKLCEQNIGLYKMVERQLKANHITPESITKFVADKMRDWAADYHLPYPIKYDRSWARLEVDVMRDTIRAALEQALSSAKKVDQTKQFCDAKIKAMVHYATECLESLSQMQILNAREEKWQSRLQSAGAEEYVAEGLAEQICNLIGNPVPREPARRLPPRNRQCL